MEADQKMDVVYGDHHVYQNSGNHLIGGITDNGCHLLAGARMVMASLLLPFL
jgi:hypothetical protein